VLHYVVGDATSVNYYKLTQGQVKHYSQSVHNYWYIPAKLYSVILLSRQPKQ